MKVWAYLPWGLATVLLIVVLALLRPVAAPVPGPEQTASASCTGLLNIGSCNVEATQQPAEPPEKRSNTASILALIMVGAVALVVGGLLAEQRLYEQLGGA